MSDVAAVRRLIEERFPHASSPFDASTIAVSTGIAALDHILPGAGFARGKMTAWHTQASAAALLRAACRAAAVNGERTAWIDSDNRISLDHTDIADSLVVKSSSTLNAWRSAERLLYTGGLGLVVLFTPGPDHTTAIRLTRAAHESGTALVVVAHDVPIASVRVRSRFLVDQYQWIVGPFGTPALPSHATIEVWVEKLGYQARTILTLPCVPYAVRLCSSSSAPDRRGVAPRDESVTS